MKLKNEIIEHYELKKFEIQKRLKEFEDVKRENYFYELCFCICTPQSKAVNAFIVQNRLMKLNFEQKNIEESELVEILRKPENYIRFHNQKAKRLLELKKDWTNIELIINSDLDNFNKRNTIAKRVKGIGFKEASHFLRNIGFKGLGILDRHILRLLVENEVYSEIPNILTEKRYLEVEKSFISYSNLIGIDIDELDLVFWSFINGEIIK
jgi:N-glycosylase/DNA lyase